jgi:hypothetical protein
MVVTGDMADDVTDFHKSDKGRRHSWHGTKALVKRVLSWRVPHYLMRVAATVAGGRIRRERLPAPAHVKAVEASMGGVTFVMNRPDRCIIAKELYWGRGVRPGPAAPHARAVFWPAGAFIKKRAPPPPRRGGGGGGGGA